MKLKFQIGDVLVQPVFGHGCNCRGAMGAGLAKDVRRLFPGAFATYQQLCKRGLFAPGRAFAWVGANGPTIFHMATQDRPGPHVSLGWIQGAIGEALMTCEAFNIEQLAIPWIGCGIGGLTRDQVRPVLEEAAGASSVQLIVFEKG